MRYIGIKDQKIVLVSDKPFRHDDLLVIPVEASSASEAISSIKLREGRTLNRYGPHDPTKLRLALVGNWKQRCGISTYSENLWPEVAKHVGEFKLFVEENDDPTSDPRIFGNRLLGEDQVEACWKRGKPLGGLVDALAAYDPDVVWIQHEFGIWPNARHWLSLMTRLSSHRVIVTMHSVFPHHKDKAICEAAIPEVIVHLEGAKAALERKGHSGRIHVIPHGCYPPSDTSRLWNLYGSEHTFLQAGFGFRYKNFKASIETCALLKPKYPDVFFTAIFSESPFAKIEHQAYYDELIALTKKLQLEDNVAIIRGFQSEEALDSYIRTNRATIFPYANSPEHEVFGSSGAARMAMAKGVPVVTSAINHFSDLPTLKAQTPEELAAVLDGLFSNPLTAKSQVDLQLKYIADNSWDRAAKRHLDVFRQKR